MEHPTPTDPPRHLAEPHDRPEPGHRSPPSGDPTTRVLVGTLTAVLLVVGLAIATLTGSGPTDARRTADAKAAAAPADGPTTAAGPATSPTAPPPAPVPAAVGGPLPIAAVALHHPGGSGEDSPAEAPSAADGDPATAWTTQRYASPEFGGLRPGVGLRFDLGAPRAVSSVRLTLPIPGGDLRVHAGDDGGDGLVQRPPVAVRTGTPTTFSLDLAAPVTARYWVVWFERLPPEGRAGIAEVAFSAA